MNRVLRSKVDIGVAFSSASKRRLTTARSFSADDGDGSGACEPALVSAAGLKPELNAATAPEPRSVFKKRWLRLRTKSLLRVIVRSVYHVVKPVLRSAFFRLRAYFTEGLRRDLVNEIQQASAQIRHEALLIKDALRQEVGQNVQTAKELLWGEIRGVGAATLQEVQAARESLRGEIQAAGAAGLREVQAAKETLSQAALDLHNLLSGIFPRVDRIEVYSAASARRVAINCGPGEVLVRTEVGYILCAESDHALLAGLVEAGELEPGTRQLLQRLLKPGDVFVDVGANVGMHTIAAARAMQGVGKIIAFEPFGPTKRLLEKSVWINGFSEITEIHEAAVSNTHGSRELFLGATSGHHSLFPLDSPPELSPRPVEVQLVRLDEIVFSHQRVDLIKIDAEGAELEALESGASLIMCNPDIALIVEFGPSHLKRTGQTARQWLDAFTKLELHSRVINAYTGALEDWSLDRIEATDSVNLFFAREDSKAWARATV